MADDRIAKRDRFLAAVGDGPVVMGILNVTPDSFSDGGLHASGERALDHAARMYDEGAAIVDIGAESTRPGATAISAEEEWARLQPFLAKLCASLPVAVSIDTYKASVAQQAVACGAAVLNDVQGLQGDPEMAAVAARTESAVIAMHNRAKVDGSIDILDDVRQFFERTLRIAKDAGVPENRVILDPGIGFGKTLAQNYEILAHLGKLRDLGRPILLGLSRKRMIGEVLKVEMNARLNGTLAANTLGLANGADILRVHDVRPHVEAIKIFNEMRAVL